MMPDIDWDKILDDEDRIIRNSDRKQRDHFNSMDAMSEEFVYKKSMERYLQEEFEYSKDQFDFTKNLCNEKLAEAIRKLTPRQRQVVELHYWHGYNQVEIAKMLGCKKQSVNEAIKAAIKKLAKHMTA